MRMTGRLIILISALLVFFQACSNDVIFSSVSSVVNNKSQNGEPYKGKPDSFNLNLPNQRCNEIGANGQPLPNSQIYVFASGAAQVVRENCVDIIPKDLTDQDYAKTANGDLIYQNQIFANNSSQGDFDVLAASCPAGKTLLANPVRKNLLTSALDLFSVFWQHTPGVGVTFDGSMFSLPAYKIQVFDPSQAQGWNGVAQSQMLSSAQTYVFSFFVKSSATEKAVFGAFYFNNHDIEIEFDLVTGASQTVRSTGATIVATRAQTFNGNLYLSVYYRLATSSSSNMGIKSSSTLLGSELSATALQLEQLSNFCSP